MSAVARSSALWLEQAIGHPVDGDLNRPDAEMLTAKIRAYVGVTWILLSEAHHRRADRALGYSSWAEYVEAEFDMSRSYAYRLIAHAKAVYELAEAAGITDVSPIGDIPEGATRGADIEQVAAEVEAQTATLPEDATDEDRAEVVRQSLAKQTRTTTTTETTETTFDPETGEILGSGDAATREGAEAGDPEPPGVVASPDAGAVAGRATSPDPAPSVPPVDPTVNARPLALIVHCLGPEDRVLAHLLAAQDELANALAGDQDLADAQVSLMRLTEAAMTEVGS